MIYTFRTLFLSLFFIFVSIEADAEDSPFFFSHLGVEDGLSQTSVVKIFQDSDGYMWFGTRNGLNKYNGYTFEIYRNEVNNPASLSDSYITDIVEDCNKNIWVATTNGLNCIESRTNTITRSYPKSLEAHLSNRIISLLVCADGRILAFSTRAVFSCNPETGQLEEMLAFPRFDSSIITAKESEKGNIWLGTVDSGLYEFTPNGTKVAHYVHEAGNDSSVIAGELSALFVDKQNQLWVAGYNGEICCFDSRKKTFRTLKEQNPAVNTNNSVRVIADYTNDTLLLGTFSGLKMLNKKDGSLVPVKMNRTGTGGLNHFSIHSMLIDRDNTLWIGTYSTGINYHSPYYKQVEFIAPNEFVGVLGMGKEDKDGMLWFATEGAGLLHLNPYTKEQKLYPIKTPVQQYNKENIIKSIHIQGDSILCATHFGSVFLFSIQSKQYKLLHDFKENDIYDLYTDHRNRLWIPTHTNFQLLRVEAGKYTNRFVVEGKLRGFGAITAIKELRPDVFIFGKSDTIYIYDEQEEGLAVVTPQQLGLNKHERIGTVTSILIDSLNNCWISSNKGGLFRFDAQMNLKKHYQKADGLPDSYISSLVEDKSHTLWAVTGNELYKLNAKTDHFLPVKPDYLATQEFSLHAATVASTGMLYFPGNKGILSFNPNDSIVNPSVSPVYITELLVNNEVDTGRNVSSISVLPLKDTDKIVLKASQTNIMIHYVGLNFVHSAQNQYAYLLEGVDKYWNEVGSRREAYYSNLSAGSYVFRVKVSNSDGVWNPTEAILYITVNPPCWKTWWAYLLYISLISLLIGAFVRFRYRKHELEQTLRFKQMEQEKLNELHEERMRLFTNFSHELRTPLTLIINPLEELLQQASFSLLVKNSLQLMKKNSERLLLLVNNLMDIQKYEAGKTILKKNPFDFQQFVREIYDSFESTAKNRTIQFDLRIDLPEHFIVVYDKVEIEKVFFNLLSNAFKFTPVGGCISIGIRIVAAEKLSSLPSFCGELAPELSDLRYLYIEVTDTGSGISSKDAAKIFEPFYRSGQDLHHQVAGTGIGLSLTRSIVLQHGGYIWTQSSEEKGTRIMLLLPDTEKQSDKLPSDWIATPNSEEVTRKVSHLLDEVDSKSKKTLLLVDDNEEIQTYLEQQFRPEYIIVKAANGKPALELLAGTPIDLVISDIMMPEMSGIELCKRIKENPNFCHIPVILLTAKSMLSQMEEGFAVGADDYVVKPFQLSLLKARVKNILANRQQMKDVYGEKLTLKSLGMEPVNEEKDFLNQYIAIVKTNISNPDFDVADIYQSMGMSRANFYRKIKIATGLSPIEFIKNIRLEAGAKLLMETDLNISEISHQIGFASSSYFAKNFKTLYGMSPTEYQNIKKSI